MVRLAISTSQILGGLAVQRSSDSEIKSIDLPIGKGHSENIVQRARELFAENKLDPKNLKEIYLDIGPGRFTGVRVGVNFAKALAFASGAQIHVVDSLSALSFRNFLINHYCVYNAHSGLAYCKLHALDSSSWGPLLMASSDLEKQIREREFSVFGEQSAVSGCLVSELFPLVSSFFEFSPYFKPVDWRTLDPLYLRPSAAEEKFGPVK